MNGWQGTNKKQFSPPTSRLSGKKMTTKMKLSKKTIEKIHNVGKANIYSAKKITNGWGTFIKVTYAVRYFIDGVCVAISTEKEALIEGSTQEDIISYFCDM